ncbi:putative histone acetyltransferase [Medicago truncatula]|uniref:histone acetyltransferase n=1 Tax=Medicago truncatula TaxID=3880 RepID=A0A396GW98_MEDTR|nr:putative histone acetyltransferase [Medicago truncatula]
MCHFQAAVDDFPSDTKHKDIVLESGLFENRDNFLIFCQNSQFQFETLRRAKYSSMMNLNHLLLCARSLSFSFKMNTN